MESIHLKSNINTVHRKGCRPLAFTLPQRALHILHMASPALWGPGPAMSLVEASGTEVLGSPHIYTLLPKGSTRVVSGYERPRPSWWRSTRNASTKMRQSLHGMALLGHSAQGLHVAWEEAGRLRAGGQASPGPQRAGSHPPQEQAHTLHKSKWFVLSSRPTVSLLLPPPLLSRKSSEPSPPLMTSILGLAEAGPRRRGESP